MSLTLQQLANALDLEFRGDGGLAISGVSAPGSSGAGDICFVLREKNLEEALASACSAIILTAELADKAAGKALLLSKNPLYSFMLAIGELGLDPDTHVPGIHPSAQVAASADIGEGVSIGANAVIGEQVEIGSGSVIGAGCVLEQSARVGRDCRLHSRVTLAHSVRLGDRCILQSGAVIGGDGFGLVQEGGEWHRIPQIGSVIIEDDVEIGANTTIDRGALDDTVIERGCKLDNHIMIAHNVRLGAHCALAACTGIAGSTTIGSHCQIGGASNIRGHITIADRVIITATSFVTKDITEPGVYSSGNSATDNATWKRNNARYNSLDKLAKTVSRLEKRIGKD